MSVYEMSMGNKACVADPPGQEWNHKGTLYESLDRSAAIGIDWQLRFSRPGYFAGRFPLQYGAGRLETDKMLACCSVLVKLRIPSGRLR